MQRNPAILRRRRGWTIVAAALAIGLGAARGAEPANSAIRDQPGAHILLRTDVAASAEIDALPGYFDQAFAQWCAYFGVDAKAHADWHVTVYLMKDRQRFAAAGLIPTDLPEFFNGYARGDEIWLNDQTSEYYRRHLMLHEGTHAFVDALVGGLGPPWFSEGVAELLATHRLENGRLELKYFPRDRQEVPKWGRIEIVQSAYAARRAMSLAKTMAYDGRAFLQLDPYGWCWAAAAFLDGHPRYQARFRQLHPLADNKDFSAQVAERFPPDDARLIEDWQMFVANLDYGYDFARMEIDILAGKPLARQGADATIAADRGWQSSGVRLETGREYRLRASGRYQVGNVPRAWECEPGGVTIQYYHGQPLGVLLAAVRADDFDGKGPSGLLKPFVAGLETTLRAPQSGTLYFRVNDSAGRLNDNAGSLNVEITRP